MKKLIFIKLCVLLLISTALYAQKPKAVKEEYINFHWKKTKKTVYIPFDLYSNLVIIPMVINGSDTLKFILDTGVGTTILSDPEIAKKLNLKSVRKIRVNGVGMGESITANIVIDVRMSIGEAQANRQSIIFLDTDVLDLSSFVGTKIHGIIGADLFNNLVVTIDYLNRKIELRYPNNYKYRPNKGLKFPITILDNKPYIQGVNLTNKRSTTSDLLLLDSGAGHAFSIEGQTGDTTKFHLSKYQFQLGKGLNGVILGHLGRIKQVGLGPWKWNEVVSSFPDSLSYQVKQMKGISPVSGSIGGEFLRRFKLTFHYLDNYLVFKPIASRLNRPFEEGLSGLTLVAIAPEFKRFKVESVQDGSPADDVDFRAGDEIWMVNNRKATEYRLDELNRLLQTKAGDKVMFLIKRGTEVHLKEMTLKKLF
ncbi:retropepsin-like aspartic protease [Aquirufa nivalisilvae]|uniref:retropepsin-like aspartic protease n=1 Tax=Aquirufa nivalisilvae TaxID=2516557 RepID=UPI0022A9B325|nr:aspartyl protease family protein [Aquirufa nivalisilvae]MCZ2478931.1 PDZ domain-containing protein [Aquirufa nivalisilvae]